jgi:hypothetical protein
MELEIPNQTGLQPEGQKHNQIPLDQPTPPKPEIKITNPQIIKDLTGPTPLSLEAMEAVDKWVKTRAPGQNSAQPGMVELSTEHRHFYVDQIDLLRPTICNGAAAIIFRYQDRTTGQVQVVIIKLDRREDAVPLARAIAWRRIQTFPFGRYIQGTNDDLADRPPFDIAQCVDYYFREKWSATAYNRLSTELALITQPFKNAEGKISEQANRITWLEGQRAAAENAQAKAEAGYAREHDSAEFLNRLAYTFAGITLIIIIILVISIWR